MGLIFVVLNISFGESKILLKLNIITCYNACLLLYSKLHVVHASMGVNGFGDIGTFKNGQISLIVHGHQKI